MNAAVAKPTVRPATVNVAVPTASRRPMRTGETVDLDPVALAPGPDEVDVERRGHVTERAARAIAARAWPITTSAIVDTAPACSRLTTVELGLVRPGSRSVVPSVAWRRRSPRWSSIGLGCPNGDERADGAVLAGRGRGGRRHRRAPTSRPSRTASDAAAVAGVHVGGCAAGDPGQLGHHEAAVGGDDHVRRLPGRCARSLRDQPAPHGADDAPVHGPPGGDVVGAGRELGERARVHQLEQQRAPASERPGRREQRDERRSWIALPLGVGGARARRPERRTRPSTAPARAPSCRRRTRRGRPSTSPPPSPPGGR